MNQMKHISWVFIFICSAYYANAQSTLPGYYISLDNDTITSQIRIKKGMAGQLTNDFTEKVEVADSLKGLIKFLPEDIKGYGFSYNGHQYAFASKPVKDGSKKFLSPLYIGPRSSLYVYGSQTTGGVSVSSKQVYYTFEKSDNTCLFLRNILNNKFRSQLKEFYKDNAAVQQLIDTKLRYWLDLDKDLIEIMRKANME